MLVLAAIVVTLNLPTLRSVSTVSAIDEREHIDLLLRGSHGRIGHSGQLLTQETLQELCARGSEQVEWPRCTPGRLNPFDFASEARGRNISAQDPPYYLATGLTARALRAVTPAWESLVTWGRVLGSVWLLVGMYVVLRAGDLLGLNRKVLVVALVLMAALPTQLHAATTVNPDAVAFLAGAAVFLAAVAWERGRASLVWLVVASTAALWVDHANVVAVLLALVYLALRALAGARGTVPSVPSWQRCLAGGVAVAIGALAVLGGWRAIDRRLSPTSGEVARPSEPGTVIPPEAKPFRPDGLPVRLMFRSDSILTMVPPVIDTAPPNKRKLGVGENADWYLTLSDAAVVFIIGVLGAAVLAGAGGHRVRLLGAATVLALMLSAPLNHLYNYVVNGYYVQTVPRFGLSALPAIALVCAAIASRSRVGLAVLGIVTVGVYSTAMLTLL